MDDSSPKNHDPGDGREHARQTIELEVEYTRLNSFFSDYTKNISKGGTFIKTAKPLDIGTEFIFKLRVPKLDRPLEVLGRVQWVVTDEDISTGRSQGAGEPGMGIRFVFNDQAERQALERKVERVMVDSLGQLLYSKLMEQSRSQGPTSNPTAGGAGQSTDQPTAGSADQSTDRPTDQSTDRPTDQSTGDDNAR